MSIRVRKRVTIYITAGAVLLILLIANLIFQSGSKSPGQVLYEKRCQNCHMEDGKGLKALIPSLVKNEQLVNPDYVVCLIKNGSRDTIENVIMPAHPDLTTGQISTIINYINESWGNDYRSVTVREVKDGMERCEEIFRK